MSNVEKFPLTDLHVINSLFKKGISFEDTDKVLALQYYKESIRLFYKQTSTQREEIRSVSRMNNVLWKYLMAARAKLKKNNLVNSDNEEAEVKRYE